MFFPMYLLNFMNGISKVIFLIFYIYVTGSVQFSAVCVCVCVFPVDSGIILWGKVQALLNIMMSWLQHMHARHCWSVSNICVWNNYGEQIPKPSFVFLPYPWRNMDIHSSDRVIKVGFNVFSSGHQIQFSTSTYICFGSRISRFLARELHFGVLLLQVWIM